MGAERESSVGVPSGAVGEAPRALDLRVDGHVHTGFASGRDSVGVVVMAADLAGLTGLTFADQVGPDTTWLPAYADAVRRAQQRTELTLRVAAEVEIVRPDGWLAWPVDLGDLEAVSVALSRLPLVDGPVAPREARSMLRSGRIAPQQVVEIVVTATALGIERAARYAPTQLARPFSLLTQIGIDAAVLTRETVAVLVDACRSTGTVVEISEAWRSPAPSVVDAFRAADVSMVAASDSRYAGEVGRWHYLRSI